MIGNIWDWAIIIVVALILFGGANKIPEMFRSFGRAAGEFKRGQMEIQKELEKEVQVQKENK
ncbi:MAG: twin-arginine translocase TatA/TatE family subunit [Candidatus Thermoplasmatota archaeon]|nr:twin-arginine translocase TatA/TatE family subunit [Candidatus Thermoplasmatota archaeon]